MDKLIHIKFNALGEGQMECRAYQLLKTASQDTQAK